tara:strand:- start:15 stop:293 length:279 start_codon:yes stop_codon:yes gene_type:complete
MTIPYEKTVKAADLGYQRLSGKEPLFGMPQANSIDPNLLENKSAKSGLKSLMSNTSKKTNQTQENIGELTQLYYKLKSKNEELKNKIISGES